MAVAKPEHEVSFAPSICLARSYVTTFDEMVFSTDYPHGDSKYPEAVENFLKLPLPDDQKRKILWDNCARFYGVGTPIAR